MNQYPINASNISMPRLIAILIFAFAVASTSFADKPTGLLVHEWGVLIRGNTSAPLLTTPNELISGLPDFVIAHEEKYTVQKVYRPWTKPVIHFYGDYRGDVNVQLLTALGRPLVYWPPPQLLTETFWNMGDGTIDAVGMVWKGRITDQQPGRTPDVEAKHWWSTARRIPGLYFESEKGSDRFIFYEGTAHQPATVTGKVTGDTLTISNTHDADSGTVLVVIVDGMDRYLHAVENVPGGESVAVNRKDIMSRKATPKQILEACRQQWITFGMTTDEARHIVDIWADDLVNTTGFVMISRLPRPIYDKIFPLKITPKPDRTVRVGLIFDSLGGNPDRAKWLATVGPRVKKLIANLGNDSFHVRRDARFELARIGDMAKAELTIAAKSGDAETREVAKELLEAIKPAAVMPLPFHAKGSQPTHVKRTWKDVPRVDQR